MKKFERCPFRRLSDSSGQNSEYCKNTVRNCEMTNGECIYRKTVDYMSRMALEKDDFRRFSVIWEFRITGNWVAARVASRLEMGL